MVLCVASATVTTAKVKTIIVRTVRIVTTTTRTSYDYDGDGDDDDDICRVRACAGSGSLLCRSGSRSRAHKTGFRTGGRGSERARARERAGRGGWGGGPASQGHAAEEGTARLHNRNARFWHTRTGEKPLAFLTRRSSSPLLLVSERLLAPITARDGDGRGGAAGAGDAPSVLSVDGNSHEGHAKTQDLPFAIHKPSLGERLSRPPANDRDNGAHSFAARPQQDGAKIVPGSWVQPDLSNRRFRNSAPVPQGLSTHGSTAAAAAAAVLGVAKAASERQRAAEIAPLTDPVEVAAA
ncbi:unnamed protein product [Lampetra planeri]